MKKYISFEYYISKKLYVSFFVVPVATFQQAIAIDINTSSVVVVVVVVDIIIIAFRRKWLAVQVQRVRRLCDNMLGSRR